MSLPWDRVTSIDYPPLAKRATGYAENGNDGMADGYIFEGTELDLVHELEELRGEIKVLKARETEVRSDLLGIMNGTERGLTAAGSQVCSVTVQHRRVVNSAKLEALYPDVYAAVIEEKTATVLKLG